MHWVQLTGRDVMIFAKTFLAFPPTRCWWVIIPVLSRKIFWCMVECISPPTTCVFMPTSSDGKLQSSFLGSRYACGLLYIPMSNIDVRWQPWPRRRQLSLSPTLCRFAPGQRNISSPPSQPGIRPMWWCSGSGRTHFSTTPPSTPRSGHGWHLYTETKPAGEARKW